MPHCYLSPARNLRLIFRYLTIVVLFDLEPHKINNCRYNSLAGLISANMSLFRIPSRGLFQLRDVGLRARTEAMV